MTTQLFWIYSRLTQRQTNFPPPGGRPPSNPAVGDIDSKALYHELNFVVDWTVNEHLLVSTVGAVLFPLNGARQFFGTGQTWGQWMVYASLTF